MSTLQEKELELRRAYMYNLPFCSDHRDKLHGKTCRECEIETLKKLLIHASNLIKYSESPNFDESYDRWLEKISEYFPK